MRWDFQFKESSFLNENLKKKKTKEKEATSMNHERHILISAAH